MRRVYTYIECRKSWPVQGFFPGLLYSLKLLTPEFQRSLPTSSIHINFSLSFRLSGLLIRILFATSYPSILISRPTHLSAPKHTTIETSGPSKSQYTSLLYILHHISPSLSGSHILFGIFLSNILR
jgi:hypothetical protein